MCARHCVEFFGECSHLISTKILEGGTVTVRILQSSNELAQGHGAEQQQTLWREERRVLHHLLRLPHRPLLPQGTEARVLVLTTLFPTSVEGFTRAPSQSLPTCLLCSFPAPIMAAAYTAELRSASPALRQQIKGPEVTQHTG